MVKNIISAGGILVLIFALLFGFSIAAAAVDDLEVVLSENLEIPTEIGDLIAKFSQLDYQTTTIENDTISYDGFNSYRYLGQEEIQGTITDKISLEIKADDQEDNNMLFWIADNEFKQAQIQDQIFSGQMVNMMAESLLQSVFIPFESISEYDLNELASIGKVSSSKQMIGNEEVEVVSIFVEDIPQKQLKSGTIHLANLDNFLMITEFDYISAVDDFEMKFKVLNFKLRQ